MGLLCCKCCRSCTKQNRNSVGVFTEKHLKFLLLGLKGSGKTEVAHMLAKLKRNNFEPTNGSQFYQVQLPIVGNETQSVGITEIGGSEDMQRIWHHYFAGTMAIIYCYDMSSGYELLCETFQLLQKVLSHPFVRGKSILLIGTKSDLVDEGLQLYDIENTFRLESMADEYGCSLRMCYSGVYSKDNGCSQSLSDGVKWMVQSVLNKYNELQIRIKGDTNLKMWQEQTQKLIAAGKIKRWRYRRFPNAKLSKRRKYKKIWKYVGRQSEILHLRPHTAPGRIYTIAQRFTQKSFETVETTSVPNELQDIVSNNEEVENGNRHVVTSL